MAWVILAITSEVWEPLASVTVEAFDLDDPTTVLATTTSDNAGIARFLDLPAGKFFFKPRITRNSGRLGDKGTLYGHVRIQVLNSSGATCVDAWVDANGQFGTDETIQAAITRLTGETGRFTIFVTGGSYTENLTISSTTASFEIRGCGAVIINWPMAWPYTPSPSPVGTKITGSLTCSGTKEVALFGIEILLNTSGTVITTSNASVDLLLDNCYVHNDSTGKCISSTTGPEQIRIRQCIIQAGETTDAINCPSGTTSVSIGNSSIRGRVISGGTVLNISSSSVTVDNATAAILPGVTYGYVTNCSIYQKGAGNGVEISNAGAQKYDWIITGNFIESDNTGATSGVKLGNNIEAMIANNSINFWAKGIEISGTGGVAQIRGNKYVSVTNRVSGKSYFVGARAYNNNTAQTINNNTLTTLTFDAESYDADNAFDTGTYTYTAPQDGKYHVDTAYMLNASAATAGFATCNVLVNGTVRLQGAPIPCVNGALVGASVSGDLELAKGDAVTVQAYQNSGGNLGVAAAATGFRNYFNIALLQQ